MSELESEQKLDMARVEALLFAAEEPRTVRWMANFLKLRGRYVRKLLNKLIREYAGRDGALEIREVYKDLGVPDDLDARPDEAMEAAPVESLEAEVEAEEAAAEHEEAADLDEQDQGESEVLNSSNRPTSIPAYHLAVREHLQPVIQRLLPAELSKPVLGTLSMIATRQPILQSEIIHIRGKRAYMHIKDLLVNKLIHRRPVDGTYSLSTTAEFQRRYQIDPRAVKRTRKLAKKPEAEEAPASAETKAGPGPDEALPEGGGNLAAVSQADGLHG